MWHLPSSLRHLWVLASAEMFRSQSGPGKLVLTTVVKIQLIEMQWLSLFLSDRSGIERNNLTALSRDEKQETLGECTGPHLPQTCHVAVQGRPAFLLASIQEMEHVSHALKGLGLFQ